MTLEEQILAAIEEIGLKLEGQKKTTKSEPKPETIDLTPLIQKLGKFEFILTRIRESYDHSSSDMSKVSSEVSQIFRSIMAKQQEVVHRYIEIKKPINWIVAAVAYFLISVIVCFGLVRYNQNLRAEVESHHANDIKYRFLKLHDDRITDIQKVAKTTSDLTYLIDSYYKKNQKEVEQFVLKREEELRIAFEASELAKQREIEAKSAQEEALKLKKQADSLTNK